MQPTNIVSFLLVYMPTLFSPKPIKPKLTGQINTNEQNLSTPFHNSST